MDVSRIRKLEVVRGMAPAGTVKLTAAIEITAKETRILVYAQRMNGNGHVMECGAVLNSANGFPVDRVTGAIDVSVPLDLALRACSRFRLSTEDGRSVSVERVFVDYGWSASRESVLRVVNAEKYRTWVVLCRSRFQANREFEVTSQSVPAIAAIDLDHWRTRAARMLQESRLSAPAEAARLLLEELSRWHAIEVFSGRASRMQWVMSMGASAGMFDLLAMAVAAAEVRIRLPISAAVWNQAARATATQADKEFRATKPAVKLAHEITDAELQTICSIVGCKIPGPYARRMAIDIDWANGPVSVSVDTLATKPAAKAAGSESNHDAEPAAKAVPEPDAVQPNGKGLGTGDIGDGLYPARVKLPWDQHDHADGLNGRKWWVHRAPGGFEAWLNNEKLNSYFGHDTAIEFCEREEARRQRFDIELAQHAKEQAFMREAQERMKADREKAVEDERKHEELWKRYSETLRKHEEFIAAATKTGCDAVLVQADDAMEIFRASIELYQSILAAGMKSTDTVPQLCELFSNELIKLRRKLSASSKT